MEPRHLQRHRHGPQRGSWIATFWVRPPSDEKDVSAQEINRVAEQKLFEWNARKKDGLEFMKVIRADRDCVEYEFDVDKWIEINFRDLNPSWQPPLSIAFKYSKPIPHFVFVDGSWHDLEKTITDKFTSHMEKNKTVLSQKRGFKEMANAVKPEQLSETEGLRKILNYALTKLFNFELDHQRSRIIMKPNTVTLAAIFTIVSQSNKHNRS